MSNDKEPYNPFTNPAPKMHTDGLFFREEVALANRNSGILQEGLRYDVTPAGMHYLLNHFDVPYIADGANWTVDVGGKVERPFKLAMADIQALPQRTLRVTMECAGTGRGTLALRWPSMPWMGGAVSTAEWTGTPLRHVLERAGLRSDVVDIVFTGADRGFDKIEHNYERSLETALAMDDDVLLVHAMNGMPLLPQHGYPLRLIVPGWYGMASVKWISHITAVDKPFEGHQQVSTYKYRRDMTDPGVPVTHIRVRSMMVPPGVPDWYTRRRMVDAGLVTLEGRAWVGAGADIARVEVGVDGTWADAKLDARHGRYAWRRWTFGWRAERGDHVLAVRATDASGNCQPVEPVWDRGGFGCNAIQTVDVTVR
jgi:DMSO/TMAO reductase YedYZ molybdopterin-dependent catalytic subunit